MVDVNHPYMIRLRIVLNNLSKFTHGWNWDAVVPLLAALLSVICVFKTGGTEKDKVARTIMIGQDGYDIIRWTIWIIVVMGLILFIVGGKRLVGMGTKSYNKYLGILITVLLGHFGVGLVITEYKTYMMDVLSDRMSTQLKELRNTNTEFGYGAKLSEMWDYMQIHMKCCGATNYHDYGSNKEELPRSCCVLKKNTHSGLIQTENWFQCRHDFELAVQQSVFLYTTGCHEPLYSWFLRYVAAISGLLFGSITLQAFTILYLIWQVIMRTQKDKTGKEFT